MRIFGMVLVLSATIMFYYVFWVFAPLLCAFLPTNEWHGILSGVIYFILGSSVGVGVPIWFFIVGWDLIITGD